jgi:hypothetical protein
LEDGSFVIDFAFGWAEARCFFDPETLVHPSEGGVVEVGFEVEA